MELELYPWKFCRARPSKVCCWAEAEQGAVTLSCRESPSKAPAGSIEQIPFQWAGKGPVVLSQLSWVLAGAEQGCECTAGLSLVGCCPAKRSLVRAWGWDVVTWNRVWALCELGRELQCVPGQASPWRWPSKMWPTDSSSQKRVEWTKERGMQKEPCSSLQHRDTAGHSAPRRNKSALAWNTNTQNCPRAGVIGSRVKRLIRQSDGV